MYKVTFLGDLIVDYEMLKRAKKGKEYYFDDMFEPLNNYFTNSNKTILTLETIITNGNYTKNTFQFSTPESILKTLSKIGISTISLANNHILDKGEDGIKSTINYLEKNKLEYFGVYNTNYYINDKDCNIYIMGYTDSTNYNVNKQVSDNVNLLKSSKEIIKKDYKNNFQKIYHKINPEIRIKINNILKRPIKPIVDKGIIKDNKYINEIENLIEINKDNQIIMYCHMGGQYNIEPGTYVNSLIKHFSKYNINSIIGCHPHIIQTKIIENNKNIFPSLGGLVISPTSKFVLWDSLPQYSIALNYYYKNKNLIKITCEFFICVKDNKSYLKVYPFYKYYKDNKNEKLYNEFLQVYNRFFNTNENKVRVKKEYIVIDKYLGV